MENISHQLNSFSF